jgi:hypothetical protein
MALIEKNKKLTKNERIDHTKNVDKKINSCKIGKLITYLTKI